MGDPIDFESDVRQGNWQSFDDAFVAHRQRLWQIVHFRMNAKIRARVDPDDIVQQIYLDAKQRLSHFASGDFPSFFLWLRLVATQTLSRTHRQHLGTKSRSVDSERCGQTSHQWGDASQSLSQQFVAQMTTPSGKLMRKELLSQLDEALEAMGEMDREILAMRHFEELTNQEVSFALGISEKAANMRYLRALQRLRGVLESIDRLA